MAEAGFPDGSGFPQISFAYNSSSEWQRLAEYLEKRWNVKG